MSEPAGPNPFRSGPAVTGEFFTDRTEEVKRLAAYMESGHNAVLIAPRRYGKSSLIREAMARARRRKVRVGLANLQFCVDEQGVIDELATAITVEVLGWARLTLDKLQQRARSVELRLDFELNEAGRPVARVGAGSRPVHRSLSEVLGLLRESGPDRRPVALAVDEIQRLADLNPDLAGFFKGAVDELPEVSFVIAGSQRRVMEAMVQGPGAPLLNIGTPLPIPQIPAPEMVRFLVRRSQQGGKPMLSETATRIVEIGRGVPYYIQELARHAFSEARHDWIDEQDLERAVTLLTEAQEALGIPLYNRLTLQQKRILQAIALAPVAEPQSAGFVRRSGVPPASVRASLERLEDSEMVEFAPPLGWRVANPFFERWLRTSMGVERA